MMELSVADWQRHSKVRQESLSEAEKEVILDQVNTFWRDKHVLSEEELTAQSYAIALADALYFALFLRGDTTNAGESVKGLKVLIHSRWGRGRR